MNTQCRVRGGDCTEPVELSEPRWDSGLRTPGRAGSWWAQRVHAGRSEIVIGRFRLKGGSQPAP